jgi:hypothetical protein
MARYKQAHSHHDAEFCKTLPMMLAKRWFSAHEPFVETAIKDTNSQDLLFWTEGSLEFAQVAEYLIHNKLTAMSDILSELSTSKLGKYFYTFLQTNIHQRGINWKNRGEYRAKKYNLDPVMWNVPIANELEDIIAEWIYKYYYEYINAFRKEANHIKAILKIHNS